MLAGRNEGSLITLIDRQLAKRQFQFVARQRSRIGRKGAELDPVSRRLPFVFVKDPRASINTRERVRFVIGHVDQGLRRDRALSSGGAQRNETHV